MTKSLVRALVILLAVLVAVPAMPAARDAKAAENAGLERATPESVGMSAERLERVTAAMQGYIDRNLVAGTVTLIARRGKVVHYEAHGLRDVENGQPMEADAIFRIASMTKPITSVALMMLWEEGHFQLRDPIGKWLPEFAEMTVAVAPAADEYLGNTYKEVDALRPIFSA